MGVIFFRWDLQTPCIKNSAFKSQKEIFFSCFSLLLPCLFIFHGIYPWFCLFKCSLKLSKKCLLLWKCKCCLIWALNKSMLFGSISQCWYYVIWTLNIVWFGRNSLKMSVLLDINSAVLFTSNSLKMSVLFHVWKTVVLLGGNSIKVSVLFDMKCETCLLLLVVIAWKCE